MINWTSHKLLLLFLLTPLFAFSQNWTGKWKTTFQGLDIYLDIQEETNQVLLTIPAQGIEKQKADNSEIDGSHVDFYFQKYSASYYGDYIDGEIVGTWKQAGKDNAMTFVPFEGKVTLNRPQEPKGPYDYEIEDVVFQNEKDKIDLAGTVTKPQGKGPFPAIVLVSGSGPQNRDSDIFKHKPFKVLADYFTNKGYVVLRYDDRGVGESSGKFRGATSEDLSYDTEAAVEFLTTQSYVDQKAIGIMGHSEGGLIAPMVASRNKNVDYLVLLAGPGDSPVNILSTQLKNSYKDAGISSEGMDKVSSYLDKILGLLATQEPNDKIIDEFQGATNMLYRRLDEKDQNILGANEKAFYFSIAPGLIDPWMRYFLQTKPEKYLSKVKVPVLAINGKKDVQVLAKDNLKAIKKAIKSGGNKKVKTKKFGKLNHLFQSSKTGKGFEYAIIEETFNPKAMDYIYKWLEKTVK